MHEMHDLPQLLSFVFPCHTGETQHCVSGAHLTHSLQQGQEDLGTQTWRPVQLILLQYPHLKQHARPLLDQDVLWHSVTVAC